uniref:Peptidase M14 domain-containing protein n=1 Tax=Strigamia maritima TaxID=126957 RepID=T1J4X5_STRMM
MIPPRIAVKFKKTLQTLKIPNFILIDNVQRVISEERKANEGPLNFFPFTRTLTWNKYHRLDTIYQYLEQLANANPHIAKVINIGKSFEGRALKLIKIGSSRSSQNKPAIWIDAGIHAREWIAPATTLYIIDQASATLNLYFYFNIIQLLNFQLVNNYKHNKELVDQVVWYILPVVNPDGYEYSHTNQRLWRKTRSTNRNLVCTGVDGNRNFDFNWNQGGSSSNSCSQTYHGPYAFSEPETKAIAKFILDNKNQIKFFLSLHSYSQVLLVPWGHTSKLPDDFVQLESIGKKAMDTLTLVHGTPYEVGNTNLIISPDWAKGIAGIKYSYVLELRDKGRYGFMLPPLQILPTGQETWEAIYRFLNWLSISHPLYGHLVTIGRSFEGKPLRVVKVKFVVNIWGHVKPAVGIDAGMHAREWISPVTAVFIIDQVVFPTMFLEIRKILTLLRFISDKIDWYILPVLNPDGYEFSHQKLRLWRKTRSMRVGNSSYNCIGSDGNRNFGFFWNRVGTSSNPCSEVYAGVRAFSESETRAVADFVPRTPNIKLFLSLHSYKLLLMPWGHTRSRPIMRKWSTNTTSGVSTDWAKGVAGIKCTYILYHDLALTELKIKFYDF